MLLLLNNQLNLEMKQAGEEGQARFHNRSAVTQTAQKQRSLAKEKVKVPIYHVHVRQSDEQNDGWTFFLLGEDISGNVFLDQSEALASEEGGKERERESSGDPLVGEGKWTEWLLP